MRYIIGVLVLLTTMCLTIILLGGTITNYLNLPTLFLLLLVIAAVIIMKGGFKTFITAINAVFSKKYNISSIEKEKAVRMFKLLSKSVIYGMVLLTMISVVNMMMGLDFSLFETNSLLFINVVFANIAAALISVFYGLLLNLAFFNPIVSILESRQNADVKTVISEKQVMDKLLELCYKQGVSPEDILGASEISFRK